MDPKRLARAHRRIDAVKSNIRTAAREQLAVSSMRIVGTAKARAPVGETRELRDSIRWEWDGDLATNSGTNAEHSIFREFGTRYQSADPFLLPAFKIEAPLFKRGLNQRIQAEMRKVRRYL